MGAGEGKKSEILGGPSEGGSEGGSSVRSGAGWSRGVRTNNHNNHNHNNTNTARSGVEANPEEVWPRKGWGGRGPEGWAPKGLTPSPRVQGLGSRSEYKSLGLGFFWVQKCGQNTKTLKLAKVGLAKVGQHSETLKLAKVGLAKVGLAKVGHDPTRRVMVSGIMGALDTAPTLHFVEPGLKISDEDWIKVVDECIALNCAVLMEPGRQFLLLARLQAGL